MLYFFYFVAFLALLSCLGTSLYIMQPSKAATFDCERPMSRRINTTDMTGNSYTTFCVD